MFDMLNDKQRTAAHAPLGALLIIAGAGTGKTLTLTARLSFLISQGASPKEICALTFTNKAAKEMRERVKAIITDYQHKNGAAEEPFIGTFHSFCASILRNEGSLIGRSRGFTIFDDDDSLRLIKKVVRERGLEKNMRPASLLRAISQIKSGSAEKGEICAAERWDEELFKECVDAYEASLLRNNAFDFDDLLEKTVHLFAQYPEVRSRYEGIYRHILIDEYQDINAMQHAFIRSFSKNFISKNGSVSAVGDDYQLIYSWRGSNIKFFLNFQNDWPEARMVALEENYRSTPQILEAANSVITHNQNQYTKALWTKGQGGDVVTVQECIHENAESSWIASSIIDLHEKHEKENIAILYRTNAQSRAIEQALIIRDIPYAIFGGISFYSRLEIKDVVAAIRYALNQNDEISKERLRKCIPSAKRDAVYEMLAKSSALSPASIISTFLETSGYYEYLKKNFKNINERQENIASLSVFAKEFEELPLFLEKVSLLEAHDAIGKRSKKNSYVILSTVHLAKGLEFDHVFVAGVNEGTLPHARSLSYSSSIEEERRLMYVAMTRARKTLTISFYQHPSRFLFEIPQGHLNLTLREEYPSIDDEERYIEI